MWFSSPTVECAAGNSYFVIIVNCKRKSQKRLSFLKVQYSVTGRNITDGLDILQLQ